MRKQITIVVQKDTDYKQAILSELKDNHIHQTRIADLYACAIAQGRGYFSEVNTAIEERWSHSGLIRVMTMAWKLIKSPDVAWYKE